MKPTSLLLVSIALIATMCSEAFAAPQACVDYYSGSRNVLEKVIQQDPRELQAAKDYYSAMVPVNLEQYKVQEFRQVQSGKKYQGAINLIPNRTVDALMAKYGNRRWSEKEITDELNEQTLLLIENFRPDDNSDRRHDYMEEWLAQKVLESIENHPLISSWGDQQFQQKGTQIGYCFGRVCYDDTMNMRLGIDRDSEKKIFAVGAMHEWAFHVAGATRVSNDQGNRWTVRDNATSPMILRTPREWVNYWKSQYPGVNIRFFMTHSDKFTASLGAYDAIQLGLNLPANRDWYKNYFVKLFKWFKETDDAELAEFLKIPAIPPRPMPINPTPAQVAASRAEEQTLSQFPPLSPDGSPRMAPQGFHKKNAVDHLRNIIRRMGFDVNEHDEIQ